MPKLKIAHVVSFSSEDPVHNANNLLDPDPGKKWKSEKAGEKSAIIVLQLEKASIISGIDIGNENSAYVEVLVSRSGSSDEYKVLLVMSSFMTPLEARQGTASNKVRMFTEKDLSKPECEQKWDRIKIVCTQPFNRHIQYGLSFITIHTPESKLAVTETPGAIGRFTLRPNSPDCFSAGNLFARRKEKDSDNPLSVAAAIRQAQNTTPTSRNTPPAFTAALQMNKQSKNPASSNGNIHEPKPRNKDLLLYDKEDETPSKKIDDIINKKNKEKENERLKEEEKEGNSKYKLAKNKNQTDKLNLPGTSKRNKDIEIAPSTSKRKVTSQEDEKVTKRTKTIRRKPFSQLLEDVVLVISGIQNPDRSTLRGLALSMGAKYKADWDNTCTHLMCAFPNTPKFNQVRGKGKIVTRKWIEDCHNGRKRLPWRRYCLDKNDKNKDESEDEIEELTDKSNDKSDSDTDMEDIIDRQHMEEASDTEEIISYLQKAEDEQKHTIQDKKVSNDPYEADTDAENLEISIGDSEPQFKDLFANKVFFIDTTFSKSVYKQLNKYITAYNGKIVDDPTSEDIDLFVTEEGKSESFKEINTSAGCIKPSWIWQCHNKQAYLPIEDFVC